MLDQSISLAGMFDKVSYKQWKDAVSEMISANPDDKLVYDSVEQIQFTPLDIESKASLDLITFPDKVQIKSNIIEKENLLDLTHIHNAGASLIQELTYGINQFCSMIDTHKQINLHVCCDSLYFANIAKLRALRFICERVTQEHGKDIKFSITAHNSLREQTLFDPWVNMLRSTASSMAAIIGGADFVSSLSYDQLYSVFSGKECSKLGVRQSENQLKILIDESHLYKTKDPAKGSYSIDNLTYQIVDKVWNNFLKGFNLDDFEEQVKETANKRYDLAQKRKIVITGVNNYANPHESLGSIYNHEFSFKQSRKESFPLRTIAYEFEKLRTEVKAEKNKLFLAILGDGAKLSARANFCQNYFELLGLEVLLSSPSDIVDDQLAQFEKSGCQHLILCSTSEGYEQYAQILIDEANKLNVKSIYIAGQVDRLNLSGYTSSLFQGQNVYEVLASFVQRQIS